MILTILAAAIKYHIDATDKDVVLCGCRHGDIFVQLEALGFKPRKGYAEIAQGFIDHNGNFLSRIEALHHAYECGQISSKLYQNKTEGRDFRELISEDLW